MSDIRSLEELWATMVNKVAEAKGSTYEQVTADLEAGRAVLEITFVVDPDNEDRIKHHD